MKIGWKKTLLTAFAFSMLTATTAFAKNVSMNLFYDGKNHAYNAQEITIKIDGKELVPADMPAVAVDGRTMLPMRLIATELGCEVLWTEATKQAFVINDDYTIAFTLDSKTGHKNGEEFTMDVPAKNMNDRTMLPVRALANALDLTITWEDATRTVNISTSGAVAPEDPVDVVLPSDAVKVTSVSVPESTTSKQIFTISTSKAMIKYDEIYLDDSRIVLDIANATNGLASTISKTNSSIVTGIRTAQHEENGVSYTRVVLDLSGKKDYTITQSADQTKLIVTFNKVVVEDISLTHKSDTDKIQISGDGSFGASVYTLANPNRIVVDITNAESELADEFSVKNLEYITAARAGMFNADTLRIVFEVDQLTDFTWKEDNGEMTLEVKKSTLANLSFDTEDNVLYLEKDKSIDIDDVEFNDHYLDGYYEVVLPGNYKGIYGYGKMQVGGDAVESIQLDTVSGETIIRFNQNQIQAYEIEEENGNYAIYAKNPKEVYDRVLLLDAGHGGSAPGTSANGMVEKAVNLKLTLEIEKNLRNSDIKVYLTRDRDTNPDNNSRARTANQIADLMVSIHMNAAEDNTAANGTETLYKTHSNEVNSRLTSLKAAEIMQSHLVPAMNTTNRGVKERTDLLILNATTVPAVLIETGFLTNPGDASKIANDDYLDEAAEAISDAIIEAMFNYKLR